MGLGFSKRLTEAFLILVFSIAGFAQNADLNKLIREASEADKNDHDRIIEIAKKIAAYPIDLQPYDIRVEVLEILGLGNLYRSQYDVAADHFLEALALSEKAGNALHTARNHSHLAMVYKDIGDTASAMSHSNIALKIYRGYGARDEEANLLNLIGKMHLSQDNPKAKRYFLRSLTIREELQLKKDITASLNNLGIIHYNLENYDSAFFYYNKAYELSRSDFDTLLVTITLSNLAVLEGHLGNQEKKVELLQQAYELSKEFRYARGQVNVLLSLAQHFFIEKDYELSEEYLLKALAISHEFRIDDHRLNIYRYYSELLSTKGDFRNAFLWERRFSMLKDSVLIENRSKVSALQLRYLTEKSEREAALKDLELNKQRAQTLFFLVTSILVAVIAILILSRYLLKVRSARLLQEKKEQLEQINERLAKSEKSLRELNVTKDKFFSIIAHDLKNPLGTMRNILDFFSENFATFTPEEQTEYISILDSSMKSTYTLLQNLLQWSMSQTGRLETEMTVFDLSALASEICSSTGIIAGEKGVRVINSVPEGVLVYADRNMTGTILRNLVGNGVKFTFPGTEVEVGSGITDGKVTVSVSDRGVGMSDKDKSKLFRIDMDTKGIGSDTPGAESFAKEKGTGLGLILCRELAIKNGGDISVDSVQGEGTVFRFTLQSPPKNSGHPEG